MVPSIRTPLSLSMLLLVMAGGLLFATDSAPLSAQESATLRVMSYNIRYGTAKDGDNHWDRRKQDLAATIAEFDPDLLGTQETLQFQADYIGQQLSGYSYFGRSRMKTANEHCGIFYKSERFTWLAGGHFWLSETPEVPESLSWDSSLPRMVSWILLSDQQQETAAPILFVNTHFDHRGAEARKRSSELIRQRIDSLRAIAGSPQVIVTGDFNAAAGSPPYHALLQDNDQLVDAYRLAHPEPTRDEGTFGGFRGETSGSRIDWILISPTLKVLSAEIVRQQVDGRDPSDHYPVTTVLSPSNP